MKKILLAITATFLAMGLYLAPSQAEPDQTMPDQAQQVEEPSKAPAGADNILEDAADKLVPMVSCGVYQGKRCTGNARPRCDLAPGEPALCLCTNGFYQCS